MIGSRRKEEARKLIGKMTGKTKLVGTWVGVNENKENEEKEEKLKKTIMNKNRKRKREKIVMRLEKTENNKLEKRLCGKS